MWLEGLAPDSDGSPWNNLRILWVTGSKSKPALCSILISVQLHPSSLHLPSLQVVLAGADQAERPMIDDAIQHACGR
jgi:hypothetical protein